MHEQCTALNRHREVRLLREIKAADSSTCQLPTAPHESEVMGKEYLKGKQGTSLATLLTVRSLSEVTLAVPYAIWIWCEI